MLAVLASPVCPLQKEVLQQATVARMTVYLRSCYGVRPSAAPAPCAMPEPARCTGALGARAGRPTPGAPGPAMMLLARFLGFAGSTETARVADVGRRGCSGHGQQGL